MKHFAARSLGCVLVACTAAASRPVSDPVAAPRATASLGGSVSIPAGAGSELAKSQPVVIMDMASIDSCPDPQFKLSDQCLQVARTEIEALLPRMKRFTVYSLYNDAGIRKAKQLSDTGISKDFDPGQIPAPDVTLNIKATVNAQIQKGATAEQVVDYTLTIIYTLADKSGKVLDDTPEASGTIRSPDTRNPDGVKLGRRVFVREFNPDTGKREWAGGFNPKDPESSAAVIRNLMADINTGLAAKLAIALPITTKVTGLSPSKTKFSIGTGQKGGVFKGTKMVVWIADGDFPYAIASTVAQPSDKGAALEVVTWNETDPDAKVFVDKIRSEGIEALKGKLFATSEGIPLKEMLSPSAPAP